ncbi:MAG: hypothetical protein ACLSS8_05160 [Oscillospiraceae bacterium]
MKKATHRKQALMIAIFLLAFTLSMFSFGTTPAAAGDVAGVSTHLFLTVLRDYDHDAAFSVTYTDALGTHTKPYHAGMEVTAWSPVTITCTNHHVYDWSIDADVQEATIVGVGGITYPGGTGIHVKGTNTIKAFATNFGLHYINIVVILGEGNDNGGDNGGGDNGGGDNGGNNGGDNGGGNNGGDNGGGDNGGGNNGGGNNGGGNHGGGNNGGGNNGGGNNGGGTDPNNPGGKDPNGNNPDGNNPDGNNPDGNNPDGNNPDGNNPDGNNPDGNNPDGNNPDGSKSNTPKTGDTRLIWLVIALAVIFVATFVATYYNRRKSKHHGA